MWKTLWRNLVLIILLTGLSANGAIMLEDNIAGVHFPSRMHAFIWKNWECVSLEKMAQVLGTTPENVEKVALSMGLPPYVAPSPEYQTRGYITIIRKNWNLISRNQLLTLLGWTPEHLDFTLREDDFLGSKLGKALGKEIRYVEPDENMLKRCAEIKETLQKQFGNELEKRGEPRFKFVSELSETDNNVKKYDNNDDQIRFVYSYMSLFGDPLSDPSSDPFPEGLLQKYAQQGINGVWLHVVLWQLAPSTIFPESGEGHWEKRLESLRQMVKRAEKYGIKIYLYMNEPRTVPTAKGNPLKIPRTRCTSDPNVRKWMKESLAHVFKNVPDLGGVFTITASENPTNCWCYCIWGGAPACPVCKARPAADVIAEVNNTIAEGVWAGNPDAKVMIWDWGWPDSWTPDIIRQLPEKAYFMTMSEFGLPINRGGVSSTIGEYSISAVGPSERALKRLDMARKHGMKTMAKVQFSCTWELSTVPYIPSMNLVAEHCRNLNQCNIDGMLVSWSLGGYPSPNLQLATIFRKNPALSVEEGLSKFAEERYGKGADHGMAAWKDFSEGFKEFPYALNLYCAPMQAGPSNMLYPYDTKQKATMVCYNFDDLNNWIGRYTPKALGDQFEKMANLWGKGLPELRKAYDAANTPETRKHIQEDLVLAEAVYAHFMSTSNQIRFTQMRNKLLTSRCSEAEAEKILQSMKELVQNELLLAQKLYTFAKQNSCIGYEASNHYAYLPLDLAEKVVNCDYILKNMDSLFRSRIKLRKAPGKKEGKELTSDGETALLLHLNETDGKLSDASPFKNTVKANATESVEGYFGRAQSFHRDRKSNLVIPNHASLSVTSPFSLEARIRADEESLTGECIVMHKGRYPNYNYSFRILDGKMGFRVNDNGTDKVVSDPEVLDCDWHHWKGVVKDGKMILYKDGIPVASANHSGKVKTGLEDLWIGSYINGEFGGYYFTGDLDEICLRKLDKNYNK